MHCSATGSVRERAAADDLFLPVANVWHDGARVHLWEWGVNLLGLPDVVVVGVISACAVLLAAFITFGGIALNNIITVRNLRKQHEYDADQKTQERKAAIRRELYPKVVDDIHAMNAFLGGLQSRAPEDDGNAPYMQLLESTGKLWVIAEKDATVLSRKLVNMISESYLRLLSKSRQVRWATAKVRQVEADLTDARAKLRIADSALNRIDVDRPGADVVQLANEYHDAEGHASAVEAEYKKAIADAKPLRIQYMESVFAETESVSGTFVKLICALRSDLGLESDEQLFIELVQEQEQRAKVAYARLVQGITDENA